MKERDNKGFYQLNSKNLRDLSICFVGFVTLTLSLKYSKGVLLPIVISFFVYLIFSPLVKRLRSLGISQSLAALLTVLVLSGTVFTGIYHLSFPLYSAVQSSTSNLQKLERKFLIFKKPMESFSKTQEQVKKITDLTNEKSMLVEMKREPLEENLFSYLSQFTIGIFTVFIFSFFFMVCGDRLIERIGQCFPLKPYAEDRATMLFEIKKSTYTYLITVSCINFFLGLILGVALYLAGFPDPWIWGAVGGLLNFIPYFGCLLGASMVFFVALSQYDSSLHILLPPLLYFVINSIEGQLITPILLGKSLTLSPLIILFSLVYWGAVWGVPGLFLAVPLLMILKIVTSHISSLAAVSRTLEL